MRQRLGIAAALLGDPPILVFDEPVNGLDPKGIRWVRGLMRSLAAEGRTVFVSSHLMSEMALTADHLIVIGRGRLIADTDVAGFMRASSRTTCWCARRTATELARAAGRRRRRGPGAGRTARSPSPGSPPPTSAGWPPRTASPVHELTVRQPSLEEAYLAITEAAVEYRTAPAGGRRAGR